MERLIVLENFFIIKATQLEEMALNLGINFDKTNDTYLITLLLANIFAYLIIYAFLKLVFVITRKIFKRRRRFFY